MKCLYIRSPLGPFRNCNNVIDFIQEGKWNLRMLRQHISPMEAEMISKIPISQTNSPDKLVWHFDSKGRYTGKSGYKRALTLVNQRVATCESSSNMSSNFWKVIWHIPVQPKIKLFLWKAISNSVATKENLFRRHCSPSPTCPICNISIESIEHLLFECAWTRPVWFGSPLCLRPPPPGMKLFKVLLIVILLMMSLGFYRLLPQPVGLYGDLVIVLFLIMCIYPHITPCPQFMLNLMNLRSLLPHNLL